MLGMSAKGFAVGDFHVLEASRLHESLDGRGGILDVARVEAREGNARDLHELLEVGDKVVVVGLGVVERGFIAHGAVIITK
jgi:hypothetical protein